MWSRVPRLPPPTSISPSSVVWLRHEIRRVNRLHQATRYDEGAGGCPA
jgi:predicted DNA-binding transcriptional regulator AlpA